MLLYYVRTTKEKLRVSVTKSFVGTNVRCFLKNKMIKNPSQIPGNGKYTLLGQKKNLWSKKFFGSRKNPREARIFFDYTGEKN